MIGGGLMSLVAYGAQDIYLTGSGGSNRIEYITKCHEHCCTKTHWTSAGHRVVKMKCTIDQRKAALYQEWEIADLKSSMLRRLPRDMIRYLMNALEIAEQTTEQVQIGKWYTWNS
jgi:hypothetical protein